MRIAHSASANTNPIKALSSSSSLYRKAFASVAMAMVAGSNAYATPTGEVVESGAGSFVRPDSNTLIVNQTSDKLITSWHNFDTLYGESTRFNQPGANSIALNRVRDGNPTQILGNLSANGKLVIVNPNGVFFGAGSKVDVAGMVASTADISNQNFNNGKLVFDKAGNPDSSIINKGSITAKEGGLVALVGPSVTNDGIIVANSGTVALAAGETATIDMYGDGLYSFAVGTNGKSASNTGKIVSQGGQVLLTANAAKEMVTNVVNNTGVIEASSARVVGGTVILDGGSNGTVNVGGKINVAGKNAGQKGGSVTVTGEHIKVADASIDASGKAGGGSVRIGGDFQGKGSLAHAKTVQVDAASKIDVSAESGNAGTAVIWSDASTQFAGNILGTSSAGNGAQVEVSSKNLLDYSGFATLGTGGSLLLDPTNVVIDSTLAASTVFTLNGGGDVIISTSAPGLDAGNILVASDVIWSGTGSLTLNADDNISVNASLISSTTAGTGSLGAITLNANLVDAFHGIGVAAPIQTANGNISLNANSVANISTITAGKGNIEIKVQPNGFFANLTPDAVSNSPASGSSVTIWQGQAGSIQNAIDAIGTTGTGGGKVVLNAGNWVEQVRITQSRMTLTGQGASSVIIAPDVLTSYVSNSGLVVAPVVYAENGFAINVTNLKVDGNNNATVGIGYNNAAFGKVLDNTIVNSGGSGIQIDNADFATVARNTIDGTTAIPLQEMGSGIFAIDSDGAVLGGAAGQGNIIRNAGWDGIKIRRGKNLAIRNNDISHVNRVGVYIEDSQNSGIGYNTIRDTHNLFEDYAAITSIGSAYLLVDHNDISDVKNGGEGILLAWNGGVNIIDRNVIHDTDFHGIEVKFTPFTEIVNNFVGYVDALGTAGAANNIAGDGILVTQSDNTRIAGNHVTNTLALPAIEKGSSIHVVDSNDVLIGGPTAADRNFMYNAGWDHIKIGGGNGLVVMNNYGDVADRTGIFVEGATNTQILNNLFWHTMNNASGLGGIWVTSSENNTIVGNQIYNVENGSGIKLDYSTGDNFIADNTINSATAHGINVYSSENVTIDHNSIDNADQDGIHLEYITNAKVTNNTITNVNGNGIFAAGLFLSEDAPVGPQNDGYAESIISGNHISNAGFNGIFVYGATNAFVAQNQIHDVGGDGIQLHQLNTTTTEHHEGEVVFGKFATLESEGQDSIQNIVAQNEVFRTGGNGIVAESAENLIVVLNKVYDICYEGIQVFNSTVTWPTSTVVAENEVFKTGGHGIHLDNVANAFVFNNLIHDIGGDHLSEEVKQLSKDYVETVGADGIHATNLYTLFDGQIADAEDEPAITYDYEYIGSAGQSIIGDNTIYNIQHDGINIEDAANVYTVFNTIFNVGNDGIYADNLFLTNDMEGPQFDGYPQSVIALNHIWNAGHDGIYADGLVNAFIVLNEVHDVAHNGITAENLTNTAFETHDEVELPPTDSVEGSQFLTKFISELEQDSIQNFVASNDVYRVGNNGIDVDNASNLVVVDNQINDIGNDGMLITNAYVTWPGSTVIADNTIFRTGMHGMELDNIQNAYIDSNIIFDIGWYEIFSESEKSIAQVGLADGIHASNLTTVFGGFPTNLENPEEDMTYLYEYAGQPGRTIISNNGIFQIQNDAIHVEHSQDTTIRGNELHHLGGDGIDAFDLTINSSSGFGPIIGDDFRTVIESNQVYYAGGNGILVDTAYNTTVQNNDVHDLSGHGIGLFNLYTLSTEDNLSLSNIFNNNTYGVGADGIHIENIQDANIQSNSAHHAIGHGIYVRNFPPYDTEGPGNGAYDNAYIGANQVYLVDGDGIHAEGLDNVEIAFNVVNDIGGEGSAGIGVYDSEFATIHDNDVSRAPSGILVSQSFSPTIYNNFLNGNGIGVNLFQSDEASLSGDIFTGNTLGINLDDSILANITGESLDIPVGGVGLRIINGSGGTLVSNTSFTGGNIAVLIDGAGSDMQFGDNNSVFTGNNFYFVLQNGAMFGDTLDASQQTFDGIRASDFTPADLANAEDNHTIDVADDGTLGNVFYKAFEDAPAPILPLDLTVLDEFQRRNVYRRGNFSYAGRAFNIVNDPIEPRAFNPLNLNLSLLNKASPAAAVDVANLFATLAPAAGGNNNPTTPQELANLAPAAGGPGATGINGTCGNNFLEGGYSNSFSSTQCSVITQ